MEREREGGREKAAPTEGRRSGEMGRGRLRGGNKSDRGQEKARNGCLVAIAADNKNKIKDVNNAKNRRSGNDSQAVGLESSSTSDQNGPVYGACLASGVFAGIASGTMGGVFGLSTYTITRLTITFLYLYTDYLSCCLVAKCHSF